MWDLKGHTRGVFGFGGLVLWGGGVFLLEKKSFAKLRSEI